MKTIQCVNFDPSDIMLQLIRQKSDMIHDKAPSDSFIELVMERISDFLYEAVLKVHSCEFQLTFTASGETPKETIERVSNQTMDEIHRWRDQRVLLPVAG